MPTEKRERQRLNREAKQAAEKKQRRRTTWRKSSVRYGGLLAVFLGVFAVLGLFGGDDETPAGPAAGPSSYQDFRAQSVACDGSEPSALVLQSFDEPQDQALSGTVTATISTSCGEIEIEMDADASPETVNSFVFLAREGYFDSTACQRMVSGFVLQCGDQTASGLGDPGYIIPDELPEDGFVYEPGVVAMANSGPGTTGSQFFIVLGDNELESDFSILGRVVGSQDTLGALAGVPLGLGPGEVPELSAPLESIYIEGVTISE